MKQSWIFTYIPAILWMIVIFCFSAQSAADSTTLSDFFTRLFFGEVLEKLTVLVRKSAHVLEYLVLGVMIYLPTNRLLRRKISIPLSIAVCACYAGTDEFHQLFIEGRACRGTDVLIDTLGAALGVLLCFFVTTLLHKRRRKGSTSEKKMRE
ncbi:MAG: VanZ family protein [Ruminococcus sp.]|nr:VanZ family protein [Ruminococcus sp.]